MADFTSHRAVDPSSSSSSSLDVVAGGPRCDEDEHDSEEKDLPLRLAVAATSNDEHNNTPPRIHQSRRSNNHRNHNSLFNDDDEDDEDRSFERLLSALKITDADRNLQAKGIEGLVVDLTSSPQENGGRGIESDDKDDVKVQSAQNASAPSRRRGTLSSSSSSFDDDSLFQDDSSSGSSEEECMGRFDANVVDSGPDEDSEIDDPDSAWMYNATGQEYIMPQPSTHSVDVSQPNWPKIAIPKTLFRSLYDFQKTGVQWMATLHNHPVGGGILGDDMGMGKTYTTLTYLGGLMRATTIRNALIVAPVSVLRSWEKEAQRVLKQCVPHCRIVVLTSNVRNRSQVLQQALECSTRDFQSERGHWDYVVLDEGHTIKNPVAEKRLACRSICRNPNTRRVMLTGTPIMNNLNELWCLFDWVTRGQLLGPIQAFRERYGKPIENARDKDASDWEIRTSQVVNAELQVKVRSHFLQRLKTEYLRDKLPEKIEMVVWMNLTPEQRHTYQDYVDSIVQSINQEEKVSPLLSITWLKKLCGHPLLVDPHNAKDLKATLRGTDRNNLLRRCLKLQVAVDMVTKFRNNGRRSLIFSQSTRMLDILQSVLKGVSVSRIDGSTKETDRQRLVDEFNVRNNCDVMLLSTKAAGVGLTLTGADVVIVYDPSWTPADDNQAVDRAYRIGQTRPVHVYRFITAGTVEEKIYERQMYKEGIRRTVFTEDLQVQRYFDRNELRRLFTLSPAGVCPFLEMVSKETGGRVVDLHPHNKFVAKHAGVLGLSRHDLLYSPEQQQETESASGLTLPFVGIKAVPLTSDYHHRTSVGEEQVARRPFHGVLTSKTNATTPAHRKPASSTKSTAAVAPPKSVPPSVEVFEVLDSSDDEENLPTDDMKATSCGIETLHVVSTDVPGTVDATPPATGSERLRTAVALLEQRLPKRSLQVLVNLLQDDDYRLLSGSEKMQVHHAVTAAASATGLCQLLHEALSSP